MERILQFADSKTKRQLWIFLSEKFRKCVNDAVFPNIQNAFSERVKTIFFFLSVAISNIDASQSVNLAAQIPYNFYTKITSINYIKYAMTYIEFYARLVVV